jgi:hypothetical protein
VEDASDGRRVDLIGPRGPVSAWIAGDGTLWLEVVTGSTGKVVAVAPECLPALRSMLNGDGASDDSGCADCGRPWQEHTVGDPEEGGFLHCPA